MKKLLLILSCILVIIACSKTDMQDSASNSKENIETTTFRTHNHQEQVTVKNDRLIFPSREHYEKVQHQLEEMTDSELDTWEDDLGFKSMRRHYVEIGNPDSMPVDDKFIASTLTLEGIVEIERRIFMLDKLNNRVFVICDGDENKIPLFKQNKAIRDNISVVSMEDDHAYYVNCGEIDNSNNNANYRAGCKEDGAPHKGRSTADNKWDSNLYCEYNGYAHHYYQKFGIYFKLYTGWTYRKKCGTKSYVPVKTDVQRRVTYKYKPKCWSEKDGNLDADFSNLNELNRRIWSSTKGLTKYYIKSVYTYTRQDGGSGTIALEPELIQHGY